MKTKGVAVGNTYIILNGIEGVERGKNIVSIKYKNNDKRIIIDTSTDGGKPVVDVNSGEMIVKKKSSAGILVEKIIKELNA